MVRFSPIIGTLRTD